MNSDRHYWENFYKLHGTVKKPSPFAEFVMDKHLTAGDTLAELGCGNGRDSIFFAEQGVIVTAIDQCQEEMDSLSKATEDLENITFACADFTKLAPIGNLDAVYSRFTLHSVTEDGEDSTIAWAKENLAEEGLLLIEARGQKNALFGKGEPVPDVPGAFIHDDHFRRFINFDALQKKLQTEGFTISYAAEEPGFSPFNGEDQAFIRIVAQKQTK